MPDPQALPIRAILNGETMQDSNTSNQIFGVAEVIAFISQAITLEPGDLIITGTPAGVGAFREAAGLAASRATRSRSRSTASARSRTPSPLRRGALLLAALFLAALALRPQLVGIGPLIPAIQLDLDISHAVAGLLGTIPVLCMGAVRAARARSSRGGSARAMPSRAALALIGVFGIARAFVPGAALLILLTIPVGIGMGLGNALLPVGGQGALRRPARCSRPASTRRGINVGATVSSASAVPLEHALGGWRDPLLVFSAVTLGLFVAVARADARRARPRAASVPRPLALPWRKLARLAARRRLLLHVRDVSTGSMPGCPTCTSSAAGARGRRVRCSPC